ncbi:hypothetical protein [Cytobacillus dafuensis]|uniref:Flagellar hook-length control protein FliK n=1 Tax=Cytobacillus dafuensis TaxID=1742359 RepID=A0A5B8Z9T5_CYTDA|nr:hypothetical protein [Cytobacillus dafuensis]QED49607.1 hypothetical protein FSZ17_21360 [Cytobacillus dafuensis]
MQVNFEPKLTSFVSNDHLLSMKEGETYSATVKEKLPNNEAILQIKGQEVRAKFSGQIPLEGKVSIEVIDAKQSPPIVKISPPADSSKPKESINIDQILQQFTGGKNVSAELRAAAQYLLDKNYPLNKEVIKSLQDFIQNTKGTIDQKLETIAALVNKRLEVSPVHLNAIHEALHGSPLGKMINELVHSFNSKPNLNEQAMMNKDEIVSKILKNFSNAFKMELSESLDELSKDNPQKTLINELQLAIKKVQKEPNLEKVFTSIREQIINSRNVSDSHQDILKNMMSTAEEFAENGRELTARKELSSTLAGLENEIKQSSSQNIISYNIQDDFLQPLSIQSKDVIVTTITKKLSQVALDFKELKQSVARNLQTIQQQLSTVNHSTNQVKPLLEATIKSLDQAILRSDFMLYTDMSTEKKLLQASSQLAEARKLLSKGEIAGANRLVSEIKTMMDKLMFKPSDVRVKHFVSNELLKLEQPTLEKQLGQRFDETLHTLKQGTSSRQALEYIRNLGLTYEADQAHALLSKAGGVNEGADSSLKGILLKLLQTADHGQTQKVEQILQQMTGQQLLSKSDSFSLQSMMFTIPYPLQDQIENVKVYINSKNNQQGVDWENCSLYFLLETKRMGEVGILLTSVDRTLSFTIKNDQANFKERMEPLAEKAKERLQEIGYQIGKVQFTSLSPENREPEKEKKQVKSPVTPNFTEGGYNFTI